jgi:hypothetical protein
MEIDWIDIEFWIAATELAGTELRLTQLGNMPPAHKPKEWSEWAGNQVTKAQLEPSMRSRQLARDGSKAMQIYRRMRALARQCEAQTRFTTKSKDDNKLRSRQT